LTKKNSSTLFDSDKSKPNLYFYKNTHLEDNQDKFLHITYVNATSWANDHDSQILLPLHQIE